MNDKISLNEIISILRSRYKELKVIERELNEQVITISSSKKYTKGYIHIDFSIPNYLYMDVKLKDEKSIALQKVYLEYVKPVHDMFLDYKNDTSLECRLKTNNEGLYEWGGYKRNYKLYIKNQKYIDTKIYELDNYAKMLEIDNRIYIKNQFEHTSKNNEVSLFDPTHPYFYFEYNNLYYLVRYNFEKETFDYFSEEIYNNITHKKYNIRKITNEIYYDKKDLPSYIIEKTYNKKKVKKR